MDDELSGDDYIKGRKSKPKVSSVNPNQTRQQAMGSMAQAVRYDMDHPPRFADTISHASSDYSRGKRLPQKNQGVGLRTIRSYNDIPATRDPAEIVAEKRAAETASNRAARIEGVRQRPDNTRAGRRR